jgi:pimeloyl-ACP methyl ester carboxylesterase
MQIVVDELLTSYQRFGAVDSGRPAMLVLHGWADSSQNWRGLAEDLSQKYTVYVPDLPGFGSTERPSEVWGLDDYVNFVAHFVAKLKLQMAVVAGHSNGGAIAIRGLAKGDLAADRLVLLGSAGVRDEQHGRKNTYKLIAKTGKVLTAPLPAKVKQRLRSKLYAAAGSDMLVVEELQEIFKRVVSQDIQADAAQLDLPTLLIYGENDQATPVRIGRMLHEEIKGSTLEIVGGAGHFVYQDEPAVVSRFVKEFLK